MQLAAIYPYILPSALLVTICEWSSVSYRDVQLYVQFSTLQSRCGTVAERIETKIDESE